MDFFDEIQKNGQCRETKNEKLHFHFVLSLTYIIFAKNMGMIYFLSLKP